MTTNGPTPPAVGPAKGRIDQWLWFARLVKSRSLAARLCTAGAVSLNGSPIGKANQGVRIGDIVVLNSRGWQRTVRIAALGDRRGPAPEARLLYDDVAIERRNSAAPDWAPLLDDDMPDAAAPPP